MTENIPNSSDKLDQPKKPSNYDNRKEKLSKKNDFSEKKLKQARKASNQKKIIRSFRKIGRCLNFAATSEIPTEGLFNVCLILINFENDKRNPKIGTMNDGYIVGLNLHRLGFKVFYLYNCESSKYTEFIQFFLRNTLQQITIFYSGRDTIINDIHKIEFKDKSIDCDEFSKIISENYNNKCKVVLFSDCMAGGSVFGNSFFSNLDKKSKIVSFYITKEKDQIHALDKRINGKYTFYLCKFIYECPDITPERLVERMNPFIKSSKETFVSEVSNMELQHISIFK
ncbi:hypothetical protein M9Y10_033078 [Tritrichomonas musculus]|uniref:Caspase family p20 domain-containing protein n=1 Tax=Tritrichomonas musculus TaxID=1915356 RepID=A0ABR2GX53_9EUKA